MKPARCMGPCAQHLHPQRPRPALSEWLRRGGGELLRLPSPGVCMEGWPRLRGALPVCRRTVPLGAAAPILSLGPGSLCSLTPLPAGLLLSTFYPNGVMGSSKKVTAPHAEAGAGARALPPACGCPTCRGGCKWQSACGFLGRRLPRPLFPRCLWRC